MRPHDYAQRQTASLAPSADEDTFLTAQQVCTKLGGISTMTLWRWLTSDRVKFPPPTLRINARRYWSAGSIRCWLAEHRSGGMLAG